MTEATFTPGPWKYVAGNENHGPYVTTGFGSTVCDCYTMSHPALPSRINGGPSQPLPFLHEMAEPNARLIAAAPDMMDALVRAIIAHGPFGDDSRPEWWNDACAAVGNATGQQPFPERLDNCKESPVSGNVLPAVAWRWRAPHWPEGKWSLLDNEADADEARAWAIVEPLYAAPVQGGRS